MPLYVYACQTCELELEEMHALGQAPEKSIRCPVCGGYFERVVTLIQAPKKSNNQASQNGTGQNGANRLAHAPDCICCFPTPRRR